MADLKKLEEAENINIEQPNTYADQLEAAVANVGKPYQYDWNTDQLYQDYKKGYMTEAQKAKNNVINAGKTLTGGYPDTYVDSVAQQQYSNYMTEINRLAPAFENLAYSQQMMENQDALKQAAMLADLSNTEYARYRDLVGDAQNNRKYEFNNYKYDTGREADEAKVANALDTANKSYEQKLYLDRIQEAEAAQAAARAASSRGGGGGGWGGYGGSDYGYTGGDIEYSNPVGQIMVGNQPIKVMQIDGENYTMDDVYAGLGSGTLTVVNGYITKSGYGTPINTYPTKAGGTVHGGSGFSWGGSQVQNTPNLGNYNRSAQERQKNSKRNQ